VRPYVSLRGRREFALAMRRGAVATSPALTLYAFAPRTQAASGPKVGVVVTRKVGKAVVRNRVRRRCKAILEAALDPADTRWFVVACRPIAAALPFAELRRQLVGAMPKITRTRKRPS
jgi:ribonuclease P protein component